MAMEFPHIPIPLVRSERAKLRGGGEKPGQQIEIEKDRQGHYDRIKRNLTGTENAYFAYRKKRNELGYPEFEAGIPLLIRVEEDEDIEFLRSAFSFEIVSQQDDGYVIVASEDLSFEKLYDAFALFLKGERGGGTAAKLYEIIEDIDLEHRFQRIVDESLRDKWHLILALARVTVDLSVECLGRLPQEPPPPSFEPDDGPEEEKEKQRSYEKSLQSHQTRLKNFYNEWETKRTERESTIEALVRGHGGEVLSITDDPDQQFPDSFVVRVSISPQGLQDIIYSYPFLFEVSEPDDIQMVDILAGEGEDLQLKVTEPESDAPKICVIDSGIQENHRLLEPGMMKELSECFIPGYSNTDVADYVSGGGHGTRVAGVIQYPHGVREKGEYQLPCFIANARVLNEDNGLVERLTPSKYLHSIIRKYYADAGIVLFNHSIASKRWAYKKFMSIWATLLDQISHEHEVLFIQAAGNLTGQEVLSASQKGSKYPDYLLENAHRIKNPAQSLHALTVGSISPAELRSEAFYNLGNSNTPSAFTTSGYGIWNTIKPDVVDLGGDYAIHSSGATMRIVPELCTDIPRSTLKGGPDHDRDAVGTSFAAPRVTSLAAHIQKVLPDAPAHLIRALIGQSATIPEEIKQWDHETILRTVGYGIPDWSRATENTEHRITLVSDQLQAIEARKVHIYQIPIPDAFKRAGVEDVFRISVTLAFTSSPRRTRRTYRFYNSIWVDWKASKKGESLSSFEGRMVHNPEGNEKDGGDNLPWFIGDATTAGEIIGLRRQNGSMQKDWAEIPGHEMPEDLCIAVRGHKGWNTDPLATAKYALVVTIESVGSRVPVYAEIKQSVDALVRSRTQVRIS